LHNEINIQNNINIRKKMRKLVNATLFSLLLSVALFSCTAQVPKADLKTGVDSLSYARGVLYASQVEQVFDQLKLDSKNKSDFIKGFKEGYEMKAKEKKEIAELMGKTLGMQMGNLFVPQFSAQLFGDSIQLISRKSFMSGYLGAVISDTVTLMNRQQSEMYYMPAMEAIKKAATEKKYAEFKKENEEWLEKNKEDKGVTVLDNGLQFKVLTEGTGAKPLITDKVKVNYKGTNIKGEVFDSTEGGAPREFNLNGVIRGWTEGIQLMPVGSKYIFYIPSDLAYGDQDRGTEIKPFSTLIFEVELLDIVTPK
jgi:FKBP-type peptidyl-prolyl cis-trans isomerase FklB